MTLLLESPSSDSRPPFLVDVHLELDTYVHGRAHVGVFASALLFLGLLPVRCGFMLIVLVLCPMGPVVTLQGLRRESFVSGLRFVHMLSYKRRYKY